MLTARRTVPSLVTFAALILLGTVMCSPAQAIFDGSRIPAADTGAVRVIVNYHDADGHQQHEYCSGELLTNEWLATAAHCFTGPVAAGGRPGDSQVWVDLGRNTGLLTRGVAVIQQDEVVTFRGYRFPIIGFGGDDLTKSMDIALVRLNQPVAIRGELSFHQTGFYTDPASSLIGKTVTCRAYGRPSPDGDAGTLRQREVLIDGIVDNRLVVADQLIGEGDAGGACFVDGRHGPALAGVLVADSRSRAYILPAEPIYEWAVKSIYPPRVALPSLLWIRGGDGAPYPSPDAVRWTPAGAGAIDYQAELLGQVDLGHDASLDVSEAMNPGSQIYTNTGMPQTVRRSIKSDPVFTMSAGLSEFAWGSFNSTAIVNAATVCHTTECFTLSEGGDLPNGVDLLTELDPCKNGAFTWKADISFEPQHDYVRVGSTTYTGWNRHIAGNSTTATEIRVHTNESAQSPGIERLTAFCDYWPARE